jgi:anti-sigma factor RsiW
VSHLGHRLSALIDGELGHAQRERVLAHLARCESCRQEAAALRMLKQRMHTLGEATAGAALTDRLVAMGALGAPSAQGRGLRRVPGVPRRGWPVRSIAATCLALAGLVGLPAAAFMAGGGGQQEPGPSITPAIDSFLLQHELSTGQAPGQPTPTPTLSDALRHATARHHARAAAGLAGAR